MSLFTLIGRVQDGLLLAGSQHDSNELRHLKSQAKRIIKNIKSNQNRVSIDAGSYCFHYLISYDIVYIVLVDSTYPTGLAFSYLSELNQQFYEKFGDTVYQFDSPWACVSFGMALHNTYTCTIHIIFCEINNGYKTMIYNIYT